MSGLHGQKNLSEMNRSSFGGGSIHLRGRRGPGRPRGSPNKKSLLVRNAHCYCTWLGFVCVGLGDVMLCRAPYHTTIRKYDTHPRFLNFGSTNVNTFSLLLKRAKTTCLKVWLWKTFTIDPCTFICLHHLSDLFCFNCLFLSLFWQQVVLHGQVWKLQLIEIIDCIVVNVKGVGGVH